MINLNELKDDKQINAAVCESLALIINEIMIIFNDNDNVRIEDISYKNEFKLDYKSKEIFKKMCCIEGEDFLIYNVATDKVSRIKKGTIVYL